MKKAVLMWLMLFLLLNSLFAVAETTSGDTSSSDCNWWCKVKAVFSGRVVGKE